MKNQILLVANESDVVDSFPVTLALVGHEVALARTALQGIKQARDTWPDLIIVDATLTDMDGATAVEILHRLPSTGSIPTLLLKPRPHRLMPAVLRADGIRAGLVRPLDSGELLVQVADALALCRNLDLEKREMERELSVACT